jgi:DNA repair protein RadA/Sms
MLKNRTGHICQECSFKTPKWLGKCPECNSWNSFEKEQSIKTQDKASGKSTNVNTLGDVSILKRLKVTTSIDEFDRVLGGGLVCGSLVLIGGEPGIGKSTLLLMLSNNLAVNDRRKVLYVSGEESSSQLASRAERLKIVNENVYVANETIWQKIKSCINEVKPSFIVLDSIQTTYSREVLSTPGSLNQIKEITFELMSIAKEKNISIFIVGHITKEGSIAGPKILEHMVDTVLYFEGERDSFCRILRSIKNRFGNTNEVGFFEMSSSGLRELSNPSHYFLDKNIKSSIGRCLTCCLEGQRPLFIEVQALVVENKLGHGNRVTQGFDNKRLSLMIAIIEKFFGLILSHSDIYVNIVGGQKLSSRESDLAILMSILSSYYLKPIDQNSLFIGEVGLAGEVRKVTMIEQRLKEISLYSYKSVYLDSQSALQHNKNYKNLNVLGLGEASELTFFMSDESVEDNFIKDKSS